MPPDTLDFTVTFDDFRFLQGHMTRRVFARNRGAHGRALIAVVGCALFLALAIVVNLRPFAAAQLLGMGYPIGAYVAIILCLIAAILSLLPAIKLRLLTLRMQVSDEGPLLGPTHLQIEDDGLVVNRKYLRAKYLWPAIQTVEIAKNAVILALDNGIGLIVPASAFATDAERFEFAATISKRVAAAREAKT